LFTAVDMVVIMNVWPSGLARTSACVPTIVFAPAIASTTTFWPSRLPSGSAIRRE
jgi:hypothetical protein